MSFRAGAASLVTAPQGTGRRHGLGIVRTSAPPSRSAFAYCSFWSLAAATTQRLYGVPFWPATCFLLSALQAVVGLALPVATLAIAVTHWLKGVPFWPATCFLLSFWQFLPYALAFVSALALGPGGVSAAGVCVTAGLLPAWE